MMKLLRRVVDIKTGSEGPAHDPYSYTQIRVETKHVREDGYALVQDVELHEGLVEECRVRQYIDRRCVSFFTVEGSKDGRIVFEAMTGLTPEMAERCRLRLDTRCRCGSRQVRAENGYPGETLYVCARCDNVVSGHFNEESVR